MGTGVHNLYINKRRNSPSHYSDKQIADTFSGIFFKLQEDFRTLSQPINGFGRNKYAPIKLPANEEETQNFGLELMEYKIIHDLYDLSLSSEKVEWHSGTSKVVYNLPYPLKNSYRLTEKQMRKLLAQNQFARDTMQWTSWQFGRLKLPTGSTIEKFWSASSKKGRRQRIIQLSKKGVFELKVMIEGSFIGGMGNLPPGINKTMYPNLNTSNMYNYNVTMKANFFGNDRNNADIKKWIKYVMDKLRKATEN